MNEWPPHDSRSSHPALDRGKLGLHQCIQHTHSTHTQHTNGLEEDSEVCAANGHGVMY